MTPTKKTAAKKTAAKDVPKSGQTTVDFAGDIPEDEKVATRDGVAVREGAPEGDLPPGGPETDDGGRPVTDDGGRILNKDTPAPEQVESQDKAK